MIESIAFVLTGIGLAASIVYYANILNNANKTRGLQLKAQEQALETRQAQLLMQIVNHWSQPWIIDAREILDNVEFDSVEDALRLVEEHPEAYKAYRMFMNWLEGIGVLVKGGYLDIKIIAELMSVAVKTTWEKYEPIIMYARNINPRHYIEFEYLYHAVMKYYEEHPELTAP